MSDHHRTAPADHGKPSDTCATPAPKGGGKPTRSFPDFPLFPHATGR